MNFALSIRPNQALSPTDVGDDTQRRFRYQAAWAAILSLQLIRSDSEFSELYCELHEDVLVKRKDGTFIGIQIKTRHNNESFKSTDAAVLKSLARFIELDTEFPDAFSRFVLAANCGFWNTRLNGSNLPHLLDLARTAGISTPLPKTLATFIKRLNPNASIDPSLIVAVLAKTELQTLPSIESIETEVRESLGSVLDMDARPMYLVKRVATQLTDAMLRAGSLPSYPLRHYVALLADPVGATTQAVIEGKRFTRQSLEHWFQEALNAAQAPEEQRLLEAAIERSVAVGMGRVSQQLIQQITQLRPTLADTLVLPHEAFAAKREVARDLLLAGRPKDARSILEKILQEAQTAPILPPLLAKIHNNLGGCAFALDDMDAAIRHFQSAQTLNPSDCSNVSNEAMAELIKGRSEEALRLSVKARAMCPADSNATAIYVQALHRTGKSDALSRLLKEETWILEDAGCAAALAMIRYEEEDYAGAEPLLLNAISHAPQDPQLYVLLATAIMLPVQQALMAENAPVKHIAAPMQVRLREAEEALSQAVQLMEHYDNRASLHAALTTRAGLRNLLDDYASALQDCERVLSENSRHMGALENKGRIFMNQEREMEAIPCFELLLSLSPSDVPAHYTSHEPLRRDMVARMLAYAYLQTKQFNRIPQLLLPFWKPSSQDARQIPLGEMLLVAYSQVGDESGIQTMTDALSVTWPDDPDAIAAVARQRSRQGDKAGATLLLRRALELSVGFQHNRIAIEVADHLYAQGEYTEAATLYEAAVNKAISNPWLHKYLGALISSKQYAKALDVVQKFRAEGEPDLVTGDIEAQLLASRGSLAEARDMRRRVAKIAPDNIPNLVQLARLSVRMNDRATAYTDVEHLPYDRIKDNAIALIHMAEMRDWLGLPNALEFAYRARQLAPGDPDIHLSYFSLMLRREEADRALLEPTKVCADSVVHLKHREEMRVFKLLIDGPTNWENGELAVSEPLAASLLGRRVGDTIEIGSGRMYEVVEIRSKYVFTFQEICRNFPLHFPNHPGFQSLEVHDNDFSELLSMVDARHERVAHIMDQYRQRLLPLCFVAQQIGTSLIDIWMGMAAARKEHLIVASGNLQEQEREVSLLATGDAVVLDVFTALSVVQTGTAEVLRKRFAHIYIPQWVLTEIEDLLHKDTQQAQATRTLGRVGNQYTFYEQSSEEIEQRHSLIENVRDFMITYGTIVPARLALEVDQEQREQEEGLFGKGIVSAMLIAKEYGCPLYSDDMMLRYFAMHGWNVEGVSSQSVFLDMRARQLMSDDDYYSAVAKLAQSNYFFLHMDLQGLTSVLERNHLEVTPEVASLFRLFEGPHCNEEAAISTMVHLLKKRWPKLLFDSQKANLLDLVLNTLVAGRNKKQVIQRFLPQLVQAFKLQSIYLPHIEELMEPWLQTQII